MTRTEVAATAAYMRSVRTLSEKDVARRAQRRERDFPLTPVAPGMPQRISPATH